MTVDRTMQQQAKQFRKRYLAVREQVGRVIVGHEDCSRCLDLSVCWWPRIA